MTQFTNPASFNVGCRRCRPLSLLRPVHRIIPLPLSPHRYQTQPQVTATYRYVPNQISQIPYDFQSGRAVIVHRSNIISAVIGGEVIEEIKAEAMTLAGAGSFYLVSSTYETMEAIDLLKDLPEVEYYEPNYIYQHSAIQ